MPPRKTALRSAAVFFPAVLFPLVLGVIPSQSRACPLSVPQWWTLSDVMNGQDVVLKIDPEAVRAAGFFPLPPAAADAPP